MKVLIVITFALTLVTASNLNLNESEKVPSGRILKGQNAGKEQFPHIVGLRTIHTHKKPKITRCSGCLISNKWILTSARCVENVDRVEVSLGAMVLSLPEIKLTVQAKNIFIHEKYNPAAKTNSLALIKIPPVGFNKFIRSIKLPKEGETDYSGEKVLIAGWGATSENPLAEILKWGRMEVLSAEECEKSTKGKKDCFGIRTKPVDGTAVCYGDAGGPLVLESNPKVLIGLTHLSSTSGCDTGSVSAIFINVQPYLNWIKRITK